MTASEIRNVVYTAAKDFPPRTHTIRGIGIDGSSMRISIAPKPPCLGAPRILTITPTEDADGIMLAMMRAGFFQKQYETA